MSDLTPIDIENARQWHGADPPNYTLAYVWRRDAWLRLRSSKEAFQTAWAFYATHPGDFINDWIDTFDPRGALDPAILTTPPLILFPKQREFVQFLHQLIINQANGLVEKSRDMGATWVAVGFSIWLWIFYPGATIGWGSRKADLVDQLGDPKSIFEKIRQAINGLPREFWPRGFKPERHMTSMRILNPENGATIIGEIGDDIGRGGRTLIYFKDESAHYEHPDLIEASLSLNTRVQVDISSVNGIGNPFYRKRDAGIEWMPGQPMVKNRVNVFVMDWADNPMHTAEWFDNMQEEKESAGLGHVFAQEVLRDYSGAMAGTIIPAKYVRACKDAHLKIAGMATGKWRAAYDPADEGGDLHAAGAVKNVVLKRADKWSDGDTTEGTGRVVNWFRELAPIEVEFDSVGIGAGVKGEANRRKGLKDGDPDKMPKGMVFVAWNAGARVLWPKEPIYEAKEATNVPTNEEQYANLKAQAWWALRTRCEKTYKCVEALKDGKPLPYKADELFSIDTDAIPANIVQALVKEMSQPVRKEGQVSTKITVNKKPTGTVSPNLADMVVMLMFPVPIEGYSWADMA